MSDETTIEEQTQLPSDSEANEEVNEWSKLSEGNEYLQQFKSLDDMTEKYKTLHSQYSQTVQKQKEAERAELATNEEKAKVQQLQQEQQDTVRQLLPEFMENNMELTPEMEKTLVEKNIDIRDVKLGAIELRDKINNAHSVVGGREEYEAMMAWGQENMSDKQKDAFDNDVAPKKYKEQLLNASEYAIKGLYQDYKNATKDDSHQDRYRGNSSPVGIKPYANNAEVLRDRRHINSGRASQADKDKHRARLDVTPDSVLFG